MEMEASERQQETRADLQPLATQWTELVLPRGKQLGKDLSKAVSDYNELREMLLQMDSNLRRILEVPKARKTQLPPEVKALPEVE